MLSLAREHRYFVFSFLFDCVHTLYIHSQSPNHLFCQKTWIISCHTTDNANYFATFLVWKVQTNVVTTLHPAGMVGMYLSLVSSTAFIICIKFAWIWGCKWWTPQRLGSEATGSSIHLHDTAFSISPFSLLLATMIIFVIASFMLVWGRTSLFNIKWYFILMQEHLKLFLWTLT